MSGQTSDGNWTYGNYLQLEGLLSLQGEERGISSDEMHFIIVHQTFELWFKQVIRELSEVRNILSQEQVPEKDIPRAVEHLGRTTEIFKLMGAQWSVMETLTPQGFLSFRDGLGSASGFESYQMRKFEILLGLKNEDRLFGMDPIETFRKLAKNSSNDATILAELEEIASKPSLEESLMKWISRTPIMGSIYGTENDSTYLTLITLILLLCLYFIRDSIAHFLFVLPSSPGFESATWNKYWYTYQTIINFKNYDLSVYTRLVMYSGSIKTFLASPIIGHGLDGMGQSILQFLPPEWAELKYRHFHNTFINHYLAAGVFGLLGLMAILFSPLLSLYFNKNRKCHDTSFCSIIIITSMICSGITNVLLMHDLIGAFFTILIVSNALASFNKRLPS